MATFAPNHRRRLENFLKKLPLRYLWSRPMLSPYNLGSHRFNSIWKFAGSILIQCGHARYKFQYFIAFRGDWDTQLNISLSLFTLFPSIQLGRKNSDEARGRESWWNKFVRLSCKFQHFLPFSSNSKLNLWNSNWSFQTFYFFLILCTSRGHCWPIAIYFIART